MKKAVVLLQVFFLLFSVSFSYAQNPVVSISGGPCTGSTLTATSSIQPTQIVWKRGAITVQTNNAVYDTNAITIAGGNGAGAAANQLSNPYSVQVDASGNVYITDEGNSRVQKWASGAASGTTVAGGNGQGAAANQLFNPTGAFVDASGNIYIADQANARVQKWTPGATTGTTVAGGNGQGAAANQLNYPTSVYVDASGNIYIADQGNARVQKWGPGATSGTTVAGGNGSGAAANQLNFPNGVYVDASRNVYVTDGNNNRVQKWDSVATTGITVAGGNGAGSNANQLNLPTGPIFLDGGNNIYVADYNNNRIQKWLPAATSGTTVVGVNGQGSGAGRLNHPVAVYLDGSANIYVADLGNNRIQKFTLSAINYTVIANASGSYTATVNTSKGTAVSSAIAIGGTVVPSISVTTPNDSVCSGGSITFTATPTNGGTTPSYQWKRNGVNVGTNSNIYTDTFSAGAAITCVLTSSFSCASPATATSAAHNVIVKPLPVSALLQTSPVWVCIGYSFTLNADTTDGISYLWYKGGSMIPSANSPTYIIPSFGNNDIGSYSVLTFGRNFCSAMSAPLTETFGPANNIAASGPLSFCSGGNVVLFGDNICCGVTYQWQRNGTNISGATNVSYATNVSGNYNIIYSHTCGTGSSSSSIVTVHTPPTVNIFPSSSTTFCPGGNVRLNDTITCASCTYQWYISGSTQVSGATAGTYFASSSGSYSLLVTDSNGCSTFSNAISVTVNTVSPVTITSLGPTTFCQGTNDTLTASSTSGYTYSWSLNGSSIPVTTSYCIPAASGDYMLASTSIANGCVSYSNTINIFINPLPTASISPAGHITYCSSSSATLFANSGFGLVYVWQLNGVGIPGAGNSYYTPTLSGNYTAIVIDANTGCAKTSNTDTISILPTPGTPVINSSGPNTFCQGDSVILSTASVTGISYQWKQNGIPVSGATSVSNTVMTQGTYTITASNGSGCSATSSAVSVTVLTIPTATITAASATSFCQGGSVVLNANTGTGFNYQWYSNTGSGPVIISGATTSSYIAIDSAVYFVTVTGSNGCAANAASVPVSVYNPVANINVIGSTTFCSGDSVLLIASAGASYSYHWLRNGAAISNANGISYGAKDSADYNLTVADAFGCRDTSFTVTTAVMPRPSSFIIYTSGNINICPGDTVQLYTLFVPGLNYQWKVNGTDIFLANDTSYFATDTGIYNIVASTGIGCATTSANSYRVAYLPAPFPVISVNGSDLCTGTFPSYQWYLDGNLITGATSSCYTPLQDGNYTVVVKDPLINCEGVSALYTWTGLSVQNTPGSSTSVKIYPNPARSIIHIVAAAKVDCIISGIEGKMVLKKTNVHEMDISSLPAGIYMLRIYEADILIHTEKLVKN